jgi:hypothetical protein
MVTRSLIHKNSRPEDCLTGGALRYTDVRPTDRPSGLTSNT